MESSNLRGVMSQQALLYQQDKSKFCDLPNAMKKMEKDVVLAKKQTPKEFLAQMKAHQEILNIDKEYRDVQALQEGEGQV